MSGRDAHRQITTLFSVVLMVLGVFMVVRAVSGGGGPLSIGVVLGILFIAAGAGRLWMARSL